MPNWYQVGLPQHLTWHGNAPHWRTAIIAESRKDDQSAFTGRNLLRVFEALHTQFGVALDLIMVLVDVPRERVVMAAFPSFLGRTTGAGTPMPTSEQYGAMRRGETVMAGDVRVIGGDEQLRKAAAAAEQRLAAEHGVRQQGIMGPDGAKWSVYLKEISARPVDFLEADGHTLTESGSQQVERFVRGVVIAAREWVPEIDETRRGEVEISVQRTSPVTGPSLRESLAPSSQPSSQASSSGGCYVATAIYGSYESPEVLVLRRWRDSHLLRSAGGRAFVRCYYSISPKLVAHFGHRTWFSRAARPIMDSIVAMLKQREALEDSQKGR